VRELPGRTQAVPPSSRRAKPLRLQVPQQPDRGQRHGPAALARALGDGNGLVYPMRSGRAIAMSTIPKMLQYHEVAAVPHGLRSSFRDWSAKETGHPREVIEAALAHVVQNKVEAACACPDLFARRRRLMEEWSPYRAGDASAVSVRRDRS